MGRRPFQAVRHEISAASLRASGPPIDWATEIVIVAALGRQPTLSYKVYLSLSEEPTGLHVLVHERQPGPDEDQLTAISYPTVLAIVRTDAIDVAFHLQPPVQDRTHTRAGNEATRGVRPVAVGTPRSPAAVTTNAGAGGGVLEGGAGHSTDRRPRNAAVLVMLELPDQSQRVAMQYRQEHPTEQAPRRRTDPHIVGSQDVRDGVESRCRAPTRCLTFPTHLIRATG